MCQSYSLIHKFSRVVFLNNLLVAIITFATLTTNFTNVVKYSIAALPEFVNGLLVTFDTMRVTGYFITRYVLLVVLNIGITCQARPQSLWHSIVELGMFAVSLEKRVFPSHVKLKLTSGPHFGIFGQETKLAGQIDSKIQLLVL